jgi:hypothetical protein
VIEGTGSELAEPIGKLATTSFVEGRDKAGDPDAMHAIAQDPAVNEMKIFLRPWLQTNLIGLRPHT